MFSRRLLTRPISPLLLTVMIAGCVAYAAVPYSVGYGDVVAQAASGSMPPNPVALAISQPTAPVTTDGRTHGPTTTSIPTSLATAHPDADWMPTAVPTASPTDRPSLDYQRAPADLAGQLLRHGSRERKWVALSFDDCYNTSAVRQIADILRSEGVTGTFFPVSDAVVAAPNLWRSIAADFVVGNHTQHHSVLTRLDYQGIYDEVGAAQQLIAATIGRDPMPALRPPDGAFNSTVMAAALDLGLAVVTWDVDTRDWQPTTTPEMIIARAQEARDGSVILMHASRPTTIAALPSVIADLRARGFEIVGLDQMLGLPW